MRTQLMAGLASALLLLPAAALAGGTVQKPTTGSESLTDKRTTGADRSSGTPSATGAGATSGATSGAQGQPGAAGAGQSSSAGSKTLTDPRTTGAGGGGGTPSKTQGAGGGSR